MEYRSIQDLSRTIRDNLGRLPPDVALIAGVPRSGLLAATLLALHANLPVTDVDGLVAGRILSHGQRLMERSVQHGRSRQGTVLILDDSICSGAEMRRVKETVAAASLARQIAYGAVYGLPGQKHDVDVVLAECPQPRVFEWNIMHHSILKDSCMDIDGVLCRDPVEAENDDGARYCRFLQEAEPYLLPTAEVGYLVTSRLEKYRGLTEGWLRRHGLRYRHLFMLDLPSKEARVAQRAHVAFKSHMYRQTGADLFIESSLWQATAIADRVARPVFCVETFGMIYPAASARVVAVPRRLGGAVSRRVGRVATRLGRMVRRQMRPGG